MTGIARSGARAMVPLLAVAVSALLAGCGSDSGKGVSVDERAPAFTLPAADGEPVSLSDLLEDRSAAVLVFYRGFF